MEHSKTVATRSTLDFKFNQFVKGFITPLRALEFIFEQPGLLRLSIAPILAALLFFAALIIALIGGAWAFAHSAYLSALSDYSGLTFAVLSTLLLTGLIFSAVSLFTFLITLFTSPFNDVLAEKTERCLGVNDVPHWSVGRFFRVTWLDFRKSAFSIFAAIVFGLGMMVPIAHFLFFAGLALLSTFTFITYPLSRREKDIRDSIAWIWENIYLSFGFGLVTFMLFSIPVIDFFALPISVVGGTMLYCEWMKDLKL